MRTQLIIGMAAFGFLAVPKQSAAQGIYPAQTWDGPVPGDSITNAVGWSFAPTVNIAVTAISGSGTEVSFWSSAQQLIATYDFSGPYGDASGPTSTFQSIAPLYLLAGQTYYVSTDNSDLSPFLDYIYGPPSGVPNAPVPFSTSTYLSDFGSYVIDSSGQWVPSTAPPNNTEYLLLGPNFEFEVLPEPATFGLFALGLAAGQWGIRRSRFAANGQGR